MNELQVKSRLRGRLAFRWQSQGWMYPGILVEGIPAKAESLRSGGVGLKKPRLTALTAFVCGFAAAALVWSYFSYRVSYAVAPGKVQLAAAQPVAIRPSAAGKILKMDVTDGARVKQGDVLAEVDAAEANPAQSAMQNRLKDLRAEIERHKTAIEAAGLKTPSRGIRIAWKEDIPADIQLREDRLLLTELGQLADALDGLAEERRQAVLRGDRAQASIAAQKALLDVLTEQFKMRDGLSKQNYDSKIHVLDILKEIKRAEIELTGLKNNLADANAAIAAIDAKIARTREGFVARQRLELANAESAASNLGRQVILASAGKGHMTLSAPVSGTVRALPTASVGKVVTPNEPLLDILPDTGAPQIVAYVPKKELGFVEPNQEAVIQVSLPSQDGNGAISGKVTQIDAKSAGSEASHGRAGLTLRRDPAFAVVVSPSANTVKLKGKDVPLAPGMDVSVQIKTDKRQMMDYLLSPIIMVASAGDL